MNVDATFTALRDAGVELFIKAGRLRYRGRAAAYTDELRALVRDNRDDVLARLTMPPWSDWSGSWPDGIRARAFLLGRFSLGVGLTHDQLFDLIDRLFGHRTVGPFDLSVKECGQVKATIEAAWDADPTACPRDVTALVSEARLPAARNTSTATLAAGDPRANPSIQPSLWSS